MNQVLIEQLLLLDSELLLHMFTHCYVSVCVCMVAVADTPWPHSSVCPKLLYVVTTATTNMQVGRRLTHLDYLPPPSVSRCPLPLLPFSPPCLSCSWSVASPSSLVSWPPDSLTLLLPLLFSSPHPSQTFSFRPSPHRQVVVFYVLFGAQ